MEHTAATRHPKLTAIYKALAKVEAEQERLDRESTREQGDAVWNALDNLRDAVRSTMEEY